MRKLFTLTSVSVMLLALPAWAQITIPTNTYNPPLERLSSHTSTAVPRKLSSIPSPPVPAARLCGISPGIPSEARRTRTL